MTGTRIPRAALCAVCLLLAACGQKGPLFLPGDPSSIRTEIPPEPDEPAEGTGTLDNTEEDPETER